MSERPSTRDRLIHGAMDLFAAKGYGSTSIADLLAHSGVNSGSLYHFFPGKQDVLVAVLEAYRTGIGEMLLEPAWGDVEEPIERIFALLAAYRAMLANTECTYGCPIGSLALEIHEPNPAVRALLAANFSAWADAVGANLRAAAEHLPRGTDFAALAEFVLAVMEGGVMLARTHRDIACFDRAVAQLRTHFTGLAAIAEKEALCA